MKKLVLMLAIATGFTANATLSLANPVSQHLQEKQYKKIEISQVSKDALEKIKKGYGNYTIKEAHVAADGEYKLVLTKDNTDLTATFTPAGDLIKIL